MFFTLETIFIQIQCCSTIFISLTWKPGDLKFITNQFKWLNFRNANTHVSIIFLFFGKFIWNMQSDVLFITCYSFCMQIPWHLSIEHFQKMTINALLIRGPCCPTLNFVIAFLIMITFYTLLTSLFCIKIAWGEILLKFLCTVILYL
jgi:hypothetical protein